MSNAEFREQVLTILRSKKLPIDLADESKISNQDISDFIRDNIQPLNLQSVEDAISCANECLEMDVRTYFSSDELATLFLISKEWQC